MLEIKLRKSPLFSFFAFLGCLGGAYIGYFLVKVGENIGWVGIIIFGLAALGSLLNVFGKNNQIIISEKGIWYKKEFWTIYKTDDIVQWKDINKIYQTSVGRNNSVIGITHKNKQTNMNLSLIKINKHKFLDFLHSMLRSDELQRKELIQNFIIPRK